MAKWEYKDFEKIFERLSGGADPNDPKERKRLRMVKAATELFIRQGYRKTNVDEIGRRAGVAKGTVYLYFKNKADILLQAIIEEKKRYVGVLKPILGPDVPPEEKLREWLKMMLIVGTKMPLLSRLMSGDHELMAVLDELYAQVSYDAEAMSVDFISYLVDMAAAPHGWNGMEIEDRARVIGGLAYFTGLIADERVRGGLSVERFATILSDMIADGLKTRKDSNSSNSKED